jgi:hypothetical protein
MARLNPCPSKRPDDTGNAARLKKMKMAQTN